MESGRRKEFEELVRRATSSDLPSHKKSNMDVVSHHPFLDYATNAIFYHSNQAAKCIDQSDFLRNFCFHDWVSNMNLLDARGGGYSHLLTIADICESNGYNALIVSLPEEPNSPISPIMDEEILRDFPWFATFANRRRSEICALLTQEGVKRPGDIADEIIQGEHPSEWDHPGKREVWYIWAISRGYTALGLHFLQKYPKPQDSGKGDASDAASEQVSVATCPQVSSLVDAYLAHPVLSDTVDTKLANTNQALDVISSRKASRACESAPNITLVDHREAVDAALKPVELPAAQRRAFNIALFTAASCNQHKTLSVLLDHGADVNTLCADISEDDILLEDKIRSSTLSAAKTMSAEELVDYETPLSIASADGYERVVRVLLDNGADVNAQVGVHGDALSAASAGGFEQIVYMLLDSGADIHARNEQSGSALLAAVIGGFMYIVKLLLDRGADVNAFYFSDCETALLAASKNGEVSIVSMLLDYGAVIGAKNSKGQTALHVASEHGHERVVALLIARGANINLTDSRGRTARRVASRIKRHAIVKLLSSTESGFSSGIAQVEQKVSGLENK
jgi:ankyrin repeat protein